MSCYALAAFILKFLLPDCLYYHIRGLVIANLSVQADVLLPVVFCRQGFG